MKKLILVLSLLLLTACSQDVSYDSYYQLKDSLTQQTVFSEDYPFSAYVIFNELEDYYRYDVIIDEPQVSMYDITAMAYCNDDATCPVIGLFDDDLYHLVPDVVDKENNYYKGIQLSGKCDEEQAVKIYISFYLDESETDFQEYYIEVENS